MHCLRAVIIWQCVWRKWESIMFHLTFLTCYLHIFPLFISIFSFSCAIPIQQDEVAVTGGRGRSQRRVVKYNSRGESDLMPRLLEGRWHHACGYFTDSENEIVSRLLWISEKGKGQGRGFKLVYCNSNLSHDSWPLFQVYIVTGGKGGNRGSIDLKTTEILKGQRGWKKTRNLPSGRHGLRGATLDNRFFVSGGCAGKCNGSRKTRNGDCTFFDDLLEYNSDTGKWKVVGSLQKPRGFHAMTVVTEFSAYLLEYVRCNSESWI